MCPLPRLRSLLAENNRLDSLPGDIWTARNLSNLSLAGNNLDEVNNREQKQIFSLFHFRQSSVFGRRVFLT